MIGGRNSRAFLAQGILFFTGLAFIDSNTVVPLFIERFTGRAELAGTAATLRLLTSLVAQFVVGLAVPRIRNVSRYLVTMMFAGYALPLLMLPVLASAAPAAVLVAALLVVVALFWVLDGALVIAWYDLFGRTVPAGGRGRILGFMQLFGGLGSVASAFAIKAILDAPGLGPRTQYLLVFLCAGVILSLSAASMLAARDSPREPAARGALGMSLRRIPGIWSGNGRYRGLLVVQVLFTLAIMCVPHLLLFCKNLFDLPAWRVTWLIGIQVAGTLAGGLAAALVAPRWGNVVLVGVFAAVALLVPAAGLAALVWLRDSPAAWPVLAALMFLSGVSAAAWIGFANRTIDILAPGDLPPGMAAVSLVSIPLSLAPWAAGLLAARAGFEVLLAGCAVLGAAAMAAMILAPRGNTA